ncbi:hypothetical protein DJ568_10540 [Mucilaginibacter hurinus]|uniref:TM2 domain-containing protein n=1 Tax=Mucilaginibacter hurinus TaxID=2201324 RepID=A0A367GPW1_9SPHI|nr:TM2 domain-containing protein [Mucilaginibacter hurinus]RCH54906.1 hypothetical protein DJ568_10540 [Mucilaginibacter hurinus]
MYSPNDSYFAFPGITAEEVLILQQVTAELDEQRKARFLTIYSAKRRNPQDLVLFTLLGFIGIAGVQRFIVGQVLMGILYLLTAGFCFIGTIIDIANYKNLTTEYNKKMAYESFQIAKMYN